MRTCRFRTLLSVFILFSLIAQGAAPSLAQQTPTAEILKQKNIINEKQVNLSDAAEEQRTHMMLDSQSKEQATGAQSPLGLGTDLTIGKDRAKAMVQIIQDVEMKKALEKITLKGTDVLEKNPEIKTPIAILAGAASLWVGRTIRFFKSEDVQLSTQVEARSKSGGFNMASPIFNGQLKYSEDAGVNLGVNRKISSFNTSALMNYNVTQQSVSTQVQQKIAPNLNLNLGAEQSNGATEGKASVNYELHF